MSIDRASLEADLRPDLDESYSKAAKRLYDLGYRMPDCPDRWQVDRLTGALLGAATSSGYDSVAQCLIEVVGLTKEAT